MASDKIIHCFQEDFDRFMGMIDKQITLCPEALWTKKAGGWIFWQHLLHTLTCIEIFALTEERPSLQTRFSRDVVLMLKEPEGTMSKQEMRDLAAAMSRLAHTYMEGLSADDLTKAQPHASKVLGMAMTHQAALMALSSHNAYHVGCCDSILRDNGVAGVY